MVGCASYRNPALLAKITSTVDVISGGRLDWGIGAGWYENEYLAYGYDFPRPAERIAGLADTVEIVKRMWTEPEATFSGRIYTVSGAQCDPKPLQHPHPPIWIGGGGEQLTLRVVAEHADCSNFGGDLQMWTHKRDVLRSHCEAVGRDPAEIRMTWSPEILIRETAAEVSATAAVTRANVGCRRRRMASRQSHRHGRAGRRQAGDVRRCRCRRRRRMVLGLSRHRDVGAPRPRRRSQVPLMDLLALYSQATPGKVALVDDHDGSIRQFTYAELDAEANRVANVLVDLGIGVGDKVAWCGQNSVGVVVLLCAAQRLGATAVPVNYRFTDHEAAYVIAHSDATVVYVDAELAPMIGRIRGEIAAVRSVLVFDGDCPDSGDGWLASADALVADAPPTAPPLGDGAADAAMMIYTSGTTGKPKGALRKVAAVDPAAVGAFLALVGYTSDDVYITTGPLYHSGPLGFMTLAYALGQTVVVQRKFDAEDWLRLVETYRCTSTFSAPTPIRTVCNLSTEVLDRYDRSSMRIMIANAAPWSMALKRRYLDVFPPESLFEVYGSTELSVNTVLLPADQLRKPGSCGKELPMVEIRLYDDDGNIVTGTGPEATGELYVRSGSVFDDYYKQSDKYAEDHRDGFQTVGDIAYRDEEGYLYICDRKRDMIISGGVNIYPAEVEAALELHPDIYEVAVFGIPSDEWGEAVHAVVVPRPGSALETSPDEAIVIDHARQHLAGFKVPRSVSWLDELPKTGSGKILKRELRQPFWAT